MPFVQQRYGKAQVRVLRVTRRADRHEVREARIKISLEGNFTQAYTHADNSLVVPTDTMKNLVQVLAHQHPDTDNEPFALTLAQCFLERYDHVTRAQVELEETLWERMQIDNQPQAHSFVQAAAYTPFTRVRLGRTQQEIVSGVREFAILKTTQSGFADFWQDEYTTLAETADRILATRLQARWRFAHLPASYPAVTQTVCGVLQRVFATTYSVSVQDSLWRMGETVLATIPALAEITLSMPNLHYHAIDLSPFGLDTQNQIFLPTDEPHGHIEATMCRE